MSDPTPQDQERARAVEGEIPAGVWVIVKPSGYAIFAHNDYYVAKREAVMPGERFGDKLVRYVPATALAEQRERAERVIRNTMDTGSAALLIAAIRRAE